jgi:hypothetical protein
LSREGSLSCHTCCDTGLQFSLPHLKDRPFNRLLRLTRKWRGPTKKQIIKDPFRIIVRIPNMIANSGGFRGGPKEGPPPLFAQHLPSNVSKILEFRPKIHECVMLFRGCPPPFRNVWIRHWLVVTFYFNRDSQLQKQDSEFKVARELSFYPIDVVKFVSFLKENIPAKENNRKIKVESYLFY